MRKTMYFCLASAFLLICVGLLTFLHPFTVMEGNLTYLEWKTASITSPDGTEQPFDILSGEPELADGEYFRFTTTLPERAEPGTFLIFEVSGVSLSVSLDGQELYASSSILMENTANLAQVTIPLPAGKAGALTMEVHPLVTPLNLFPPLLRTSEDPTDAKGSIAYANYYGFPTGAMALSLALIWALFLFSILNRKTDWRLLLLVLACAGLTLHPIAVGYGWYFFPESWLSLFIWRGIPILSAMALILYLCLHRSRDFLRALLSVTMWSLGALAVCGMVSAMRDGYLARYLSSSWASLIQTGYYDGLLYWITVWLVGVCVLLSTWDTVRGVIQVKTEARTLELKNEMAMENYRILEEKLREGAQLRHEYAHRLTALNAMYENGDWEELGLLLTKLTGQNRQAAQVRFTEHFAVNAILQNAAERAENAGIRFEASAMLPRVLPIPDEDLCTLFMNLLDNALEGAEQVESEKRFIRLRSSIRNGFLAVFCENTYNGRLSTDQHGRLRTAKTEPEAHGFGLILMENIAKKYKSLLDVSYTDTVFTVQTALKLPEEKKA